MFGWLAGIARPYLIPGVIVALVVAAGGIYVAGFSAGSNREELAAAHATIAALEADRAKVEAALEGARVDLIEAGEAEAENQKRVEELIASLSTEQNECALVTPEQAEALNAIR